ncbi:YiiD C-terminal domain-containing protein [Nitrincola alkalilacustris]|uniref:YiiD C-terminal domain-containing protein n=1 Tax=Nitrincola alkalilacustris TaxID=1571224 RepID=UPI001F0FB1AA|nr:YiiD C-terminal domain-containing protein [Nitrincola alkalilacustris]
MNLKPDDAEAFLSWLRTQIPLVGAMQIDQLTLDDQGLTLSAPLAANINDKGTGFAGSLAALSTLSGWCLMTLYLRSQGLECDVMIAESQIKYLQPVTADFKACVSLPDDDVLAPFLLRMREKGRGKLPLQVEIQEQGKMALQLNGVYYARIRC